MRYARWSVVALLTFAIAGAVAAILALRRDDPTGWVQDLLPELIGFLLGSIVTYLIIDRVIKNGQRHTWRTVEGQLLYDLAIYAARVLDALDERYSQPSSNALRIGSTETFRRKDEPAGAIDLEDVMAMLRQAQQIGLFAEAARLVLDRSHERAKAESSEYFIALATLEQLLNERSDDLLPHLRRLLDNPPNLDLIVRIADQPSIARHALEAQAAIIDLRENLFSPGVIRSNSMQVSEVFSALRQGTGNVAHLRLLEAFYFELGSGFEAAVKLSTLAMAIGKHRSTWNRERKWRKVQEIQ
jgi:hypothetical protein